MITRIEALSFLKRHQPMPSDKEIKQEELETYEEVRKYFQNNFDERCIPLFLNAFNNPSDRVKYWCIQIASNFPDASLFEPLSKLLQSEDEDIKMETITALAQLALNNINVKEAIKVMKYEINKT